MNALLSKFSNSDPLTRIDVDEDFNADAYHSPRGSTSSIPSFAIPSTDVSNLISSALGSIVAHETLCDAHVASCISITIYRCRLDERTGKDQAESWYYYSCLSIQGRYHGLCRFKSYSREVSPYAIKTA